MSSSRYFELTRSKANKTITNIESVANAEPCSEVAVPGSELAIYWNHK